MTIDELIQIAHERSPGPDEVQAAAASLQMDVPAVYDRFARKVANGYLSGEFDFTYSDAAMNGLFGYAYPGGGPEFTRLAWQVYHAFDEGEYLHSGEPTELQGEPKTRALLSKIAELKDA